MKALDDKITQNLIYQVKKGVLISLDFVLSKYENNNLFAYVLYIDDYCQYLGWAANTISHYEKLKKSLPSEEHSFVKWYYPEFEIGTGEVPDEIDKLFNHDIQEILDEIQELLDDNFEIIQANVYDSIIEGFKLALNEIDEDKIKNIIFYVSLADSNNAELMENYSAEKLNSLEKFRLFKNRYS
jgi:hypothetical protein